MFFGMNKDKLSIGIVCYPSVGGSGVVATELGNTLARMGHFVHFISYEIPFRLDQTIPNIYFHKVEINEYELFKYPDYTLPLAVKISEISTKFNLDILHAHYAVPHATAALLAKKIIEHNGGVAPKIITTLHGTDISLLSNDPNLKSIIQYSIENSDGVTAVSQSLKDDTIKSLGIGCSIKVIHNFYTPKVPTKTKEEVRADLGLKNDDLLLIHLSNLRPVKRIPDLLKILKETNDGRVKLLILAGADFSLFNKLVDDYKISNRVIVKENVFDIENYLQAADLGIYTSETESFGMGVLETMFFGHPVLATKVGGVPEVLQNGEHGFLYEVGNVEGFKEGIVAILNDKETSKIMGDKAMNYAKENFSVERIINQYLDFYRSIKD
jgi:L-malate glycosyltransferase